MPEFKKKTAHGSGCRGTAITERGKLNHDNNPAKIVLNPTSLVPKQTFLTNINSNEFRRMNVASEFVDMTSLLQT